jgi:AraC family transcriptional regulator of adaptative response/methylated-DNA-[protein]-cysteine methyltransferase
MVRDATTFIAEQWRPKPDIGAIARLCRVTPDESHRVFRRWAGLAPDEFMAAITLDRSRQLRRDRASVLDAAWAAGVCGPERQRGLFVTPEALSPGGWGAGGAAASLVYGFHSSPFGNALVAATERGLAGLPFAETRVRKPVLLMICTDAGRRPGGARMRHAPPGRRDASSIPACGEGTGRCGSS